MEKFVDLHTHTTASDGTLSPRELVARAAALGLAALAVTDHDTVEGLEEACAAGHKLGMEVVPGIELNSLYGELQVHVVGLYIRPGDPSLAAFLRQRVACRERRNHRMVAALAAAGVPITWEEVETLAAGTVTRGHIAHLLVGKGLAPTVGQAIGDWLAKGRPGYVRMEGATPTECIRAIHDAGGLAFVAHPNQILRGDPVSSMEICRRVILAGADGLETRYCQFDDRWRERTEALAEEMGLLRSGGSDFHGALKPGLKLGVGYGDLAVPYAFLEAIRRTWDGRTEAAPNR